MNAQLHKANHRRTPLLRRSLLACVVGLACAGSTYAGTATDRKAPISAHDIASLVQSHEEQEVTISVFATGLNNPRGLKFGPDGYLYVAEGGIGGSNSTIGKCTQVPDVGPYTGSRTGGRISKISRAGVRTTVTDQLPSSQTSMETGSLISGVADVAFIGHTLYALIGGAGCSHGIIGSVNSVLRIAANGGATGIANLSAYQKTHPVQNPYPGDFEPDGTWYSMIAGRKAVYALEPNHGELDRISIASGAIHRIADISASQGHTVPTALTYHHGNFYVGNLNTFPIMDGSSVILKITPGGHVTTFATGLTTVTGVLFDDEGRMYVLQNTTGNPGPTPGAGSIVRFTHGRPETLVTGLSLPTAMTFGPDGDLFVSNLGFGAPPIGLGQVLRIHLED